MNRMIVVREDNIVIVDGEVRTVDLSDLVDERIHAIQWYGDHGQVEYEGRGLLNSDFQDPIILEELMVAWEAAKPVEPDPPPPEPVRVLKSVIVSRIIDAGRIAEAKAMLDEHPDLWAKWTATDQPAIDPQASDARAFVTALGLDPDVILAP